MKLEVKVGHKKYKKYFYYSDGESHSFFLLIPGYFLREKHGERTVAVPDVERDLHCFKIVPDVGAVTRSRQAIWMFASIFFAANRLQNSSDDKRDVNIDVS